jgi:GTP-binding protein
MENIRFLGSFEKVSQCPELKIPEYALIGRSNVGKSSLINFLTGVKDLAHISKKPGKTRSINIFEVDSEWVLTDLPGYGYAHVSKSQRRKWDKELWEYLRLRPNLMCALVLIDASIPPQQKDLEFMEELAVNGIPWVLVFTKVDKIKKSGRTQQLNTIQNAILEIYEVLPEMLITSAEKKEGKQSVIDFINRTNQIFQDQLNEF